MSTTIEPSPVTANPAADPPSAATHFASLLTFETDCWDVQHSMATGRHDFVLLDVRSSEAYAAGHCGGAVSLPRAEIEAAALDEFPADTTFVVYCAGPHCNGADRAALEVARLERPVKKMIGGVTGWLDEGFDLVTT